MQQDRLITEEDISARAYQIWEERGRPEGEAEAHWHEAKRQLSEPERAMAVGSVEDIDTN